MIRQITDPADRVSDNEFTAALEKRYLDPGLAVRVPDFAERYGNVCDLIVQLLWPEFYGASPDDAFSHTSDPARKIARLIFAAAMLEES